MATIEPIRLSRDLNAEGSAKIINLARLTVSNAASANDDVVRKLEYDIDVSDLQSRVTSIENSAGHIDAVYVDTTSADLNTAISAATYDAGTGHWTFDGKELSVGDILILNNATEQDSDRAWILNGANTGSSADFTAMGSDVDAAISAAVAAVVGDAANAFNTLGKIEDQHVALAERVTTEEANVDALETEMSVRPIHSVLTGSFVDNGDGTYTATINHSYNNTALNIQVQENVSGEWKYVSDLEVDVSVTTTQFTLETSSATLGVNPVRLLVNGFIGA